MKAKNGRLKPTWRWVLIVLILIVSGCGKKTGAVLTKDNFHGKKVGVMAGYSTDYILTKSQYGLDLYRYDAYSDMQLALKFNRIDAAAMEMDEAYVFCRLNPGYQIALKVAEQLDFGYQFNSNRRELIAQFNHFIKGFRQTEAYRDINKRVEASAKAPFVAKKVKNIVTTNRVIKVAVFDGWEPVSFMNRAKGEWEGADVELITYFANSIGAKVKFKELGWNQMLIELGTGLVDLLLDPCAMAMAKDFEMGKSITMSDPAFEKDIVALVFKEEK